MRNLADVLVSALVDAGTDTVFGIPGTHNLALFAALDACGVRVVVPRHEQGAGYAADAYARVAGRPGVVVTTAGPGALNAATAVAQAWSDSSPVLLVAPGMPTTKPAGPTGMLHEMRDQTAALAACVAQAHVVRTGTHARTVVDSFQRSARTGRPRPWYIEVPLDLLGEPVVDGPPAGPASVFDPPEPPADILLARAARVLRAASRPLVVAGGGAVGAAEPLRALAERLGAPVVTSVNGRGTLPEVHPLSLGATLHLAEMRSLLAHADAVLVVGCELAESDTWATPVAVGGHIVRVDVDPGMSATNAPPAAVMLVGRSETVLPDLLRAVGAGDPVRRSTPVPQVRARVEAAAESAARPWRGLVAGLRRALPADAVVVADNAKVAYHAAQTRLPVTRPRSYLFPTGFGTLGWAVPAAVGAVTAATGRPVVALTGDGGLQFSVAELATLRDLRAGVPVVVVDNGGYGEIRDQMVARGDRPSGVDLRPPRWPALAEAFGAAHVPVLAPTDDPSCAEEVADAVATALSADHPTLVVVREAGSP